MPCGCHSGRHWWSTVSEGPVLGGPDCGQQVPGILSVCIIIHFLHKVIYLDTRGWRHKRADSSGVIIHLNIGEGFDADLYGFCFPYGKDDRNDSYWKGRCYTTLKQHILQWYNCQSSSCDEWLPDDPVKDGEWSDSLEVNCTTKQLPNPGPQWSQFYNNILVLELLLNNSYIYIYS